MTATALEKGKAQICQIGRAMWQRSMVAANDGNISVRVGDLVVCTPTGVSKGFLAEEDLVVLNLDGSRVEGWMRPSSEVKMHLRVYAERPDISAVVHAHPLYATMWAIGGQPLECRMLPETVVALPVVPLAPYARPSTQAVPDSIADLISDHHACLLEHHGALAWGSDLMSAYLTMERVEYTAELMWRLKAAGAGRDLPAEEIIGVRRLFGVESLPTDREEASPRAERAGLAGT